MKSNNNTSLYGQDKGKNDLQLNLVWHKDFEFTFYKHLSQFEGQAKTVENPADTDSEEHKEDKRFERNQWYCNKCVKKFQTEK